MVPAESSEDMLTKEDVRRLAREFLEHVKYEEELQEELLLLKLTGRDREELKEKIEYHNYLIREIERNRRENILPIIEKLMAFVSKVKQKQGQV